MEADSPKSPSHEAVGAIFLKIHRPFALSEPVSNFGSRGRIFHITCDPKKGRKEAFAMQKLRL